uniref:Uncharacterized protein n=1 Tax=Romanomermis culicivorax TaxID=13658 RepID=A0A915KHF7_ROMCU
MRSSPSSIRNIFGV